MLGMCIYIVYDVRRINSCALYRLNNIPAGREYRYNKMRFVRFFSPMTRSRTRMNIKCIRVWNLYYIGIYFVWNDIVNEKKKNLVSPTSQPHYTGFVAFVQVYIRIYECIERELEGWIIWKKKKRYNNRFFSCLVRRLRSRIYTYTPYMRYNTLLVNCTLINNNNHARTHAYAYTAQWQCFFFFLLSLHYSR